MPGSAWKNYTPRRRLMEHARDLARSGEHADHRSIIAHMQTLDGFAAVRAQLEDRAIRFQLDSLCAVSRGSAG
jgi:hypothetical protein